MKILSTLLALALMAGYAAAADAENTEDAGRNTPRPNYELAERFSQKKISQMVFSTKGKAHNIT